MKNRIKLIHGILIFFAAEGIQIITVFIAQVIYGMFLNFKVRLVKESGAALNNSNYPALLEAEISKNALYLISVISVIICGIIFFFWYRNESGEDILTNFKKMLYKKNIINLFLLGLGCQCFVAGVINLIQQVFTKLYNQYSEQVEKITSGNKVAVIILVAIVAPIAEELIFRGVILYSVQKYIKFWEANLLQAALFGIYHWNVLQGFYAGLIGLLLGMIRQKFKTVAAPIVLHMIINISSIFLLLFPCNDVGYVFFILFGGILLGITWNKIFSEDRIQIKF